MRVLIQWATLTATDWIEYNVTGIRDVRGWPNKGEPPPGTVVGDTDLSDEPGWIAAINLQGTTLSGDHVGFDYVSGVLSAGVWNDDPADWPFPMGKVITFPPVGPDPKIGGRINTGNQVVHYADRANLEAYVDDPDHGQWCQAWLDAADRTPPAGWDGTANHSGGYVELRPWADFPNYHRLNTLHGVWVEPTLWAQHQQARSVRGWREWDGDV